MTQRRQAKYRLRRARRNPAFRVRETLAQALGLGFTGTLAEVLAAAKSELTALKQRSRERVVHDRVRLLRCLTDHIVNVHGANHP